MEEILQTTEEVTQEEKEISEEKPADVETTAPVAEPAPAIDWEAKFKESAREAQILHEQLKKEQSRKESDSDPTDSELRSAFPTWDDEPDYRKVELRRLYNTEKLTKRLIEEREAEKEERRWKTELQMTIESDPRLQGREREFELYASKPTHKGAPIEILKKSFLYEVPTEMPRVIPKTGLETGSAGPRMAESPKKGVTPEELERARKSDPTLYRELLKKPIDID